MTGELGDEQHWQRVQLESVLGLAIPATVSASTDHAFEAPVGVWEGQGITVVVDATMYADLPTSGMARRSVATRTEVIDGRPTQVISYVEDDGTKVVAARLDPSDSSPSAVVTVRASPDVPSDVPLRILRSIRRD